MCDGYWLHVYLESQFERLNRALERIMSEDAAIQAVTEDINTQLTTLSTLITQVLGEIGTGGVQPSTVTALQAAQQSLDTTVASFGAALNPPAPTPTPGG